MCQCDWRSGGRRVNSTQEGPGTSSWQQMAMKHRPAKPVRTRGPPQPTPAARTNTPTTMLTRCSCSPLPACECWGPAGGKRETSRRARAPCMQRRGFPVLRRRRPCAARKLPGCLDPEPRANSAGSRTRRRSARHEAAQPQLHRGSSPTCCSSMPWQRSSGSQSRDSMRRWRRYGPGGSARIELYSKYRCCRSVRCVWVCYWAGRCVRGWGGVVVVVGGCWGGGGGGMRRRRHTAGRLPWLGSGKGSQQAQSALGTGAQCRGRAHLHAW